MRLTENEFDDLIRNRPRKPEAKSALFAKGRLPAGTMNKTEVRYSQQLEAEKHLGQILWYAFEGITLKLAFDTRYTADFVVLTSDMELEFREIKGAKAIYQDDAKVKVKVAARLFPFRFKVVFPIPQKQGGGWEVTEVKA